MNKKIIILIAAIIVVIMSGCVKDLELKTDLNMEPGEINDGWEISTPSAEGFDEIALQETYNQFFSEEDYVTGISLLVVRNGKLVTEGYCRDINDRDIKRNIQSATKSFTSLVFGIARDMGYFDNLDESLYNIMPEEFDNNMSKRNITLRHLMTMNSGLEINNEEFALELQIKDQRNQLSYLLAKPLFSDPGTQYWYRDCDPQLLSGAILKKTGKILDEIAKEKLFGPMGITDYFWEKNIDGHNLAPSALYIRPRDMAKIGKLVLNKGLWEGKQLVSKQWIELSTSNHVEFAIPGRELTNPPNYGFYWWVYEPHFSSLPEVRAFSAVGAGGQYIFIVPEKDLVIVMTSEPYVTGEFNLERAFFGLASKIINSIIE
ncbi:serine hydrolase domain-containing protein [Bacteroidota bacterium]